MRTREFPFPSRGLPRSRPAPSTQSLMMRYASTHTDTAHGNSRGQEPRQYYLRRRCDKAVGCRRYRREPPELCGLARRDLKSRAARATWRSEPSLDVRAHFDSFSPALLPKEALADSVFVWRSGSGPAYAGRKWSTCGTTRLTTISTFSRARSLARKRSRPVGRVSLSSPLEGNSLQIGDQCECSRALRVLGDLQASTTFRASFPLHTMKTCQRTSRRLRRTTISIKRPRSSRSYAMGPLRLQCPPVRTALPTWTRRLCRRFSLPRRGGRAHLSALPTCPARSLDYSASSPPA